MAETLCRQIMCYIIGKIVWFSARKCLRWTCSAVRQSKIKDRQKEREIKESQSISTLGPISLQWLMKRAPLLFPHTRVPFAAARKDTLLYQLVFAWVNRAWALLFFHRLLLFVLPSFSLSLSLSLSHSSSLPFPICLSPSSPFSLSISLSFFAFKTRAEVKRKLTRGTQASVTTASSLQLHMKNK